MYASPNDSCFGRNIHASNATMHNSGTATRSFRFIYHPRRCDFGVFQMFSSTRYYQYFSLNMCNRPERKAGPCGEKGLTPLFWPGTAGALELPKRLQGALERNNRYKPPISLALRDLLSRVSRNLGFFRASKHGVSGYSVPLPGGSRVIVENREERTAPLLAALQIIFARQLRRQHQRAQTDTGGEREPLRITKRAVLDVAKNGNGRPIDSESQRQLGWHGSMKFADEGRAGSAHEKRV